eukprot:scaffold85141_cov51-Attheya_sp.AAC.5
MGNKPVTLGVETNASSYERGSILSGQAYMDVTMEGGNIRHVHATSLNLQLMGEEAAMVIDHEEGVDRDSHVFWSLNVPLTHFKSGLVPPGRFEYPFQIQLPANLPGSMYFQEGESGCEIRYTLFVHLVGNKPDIFDSTGGDTGSTNAKTIFITPQQIMPTTYNHDEVSRAMIPSQVFPIRRCCCIEGSMAIGGRVDRALLTPNEVLSLDVSILNNSTVSVKAVEIDLNETIEFRTKGHQRRVCRKIAQKRLIGDLFPGVEPMGEVHSKWGLLRYSLVRGTQASQDGDIETDAWLCGSPELQRNITLRIPRGVRSTYASGNMITIRHSLSVCLDLGSSFTTRPEISFLLQIMQPISSHNNTDEIMGVPTPKRTLTQSPPPLISLPEDWNATVTTADIVLVDEEMVSRSTLGVPPTGYCVL